MKATRARSVNWFCAAAIILATLAAAETRAAPVTCLPAPMGSGTKALFKSPAKGAFVAWYCPGEELPTMFVCVKSACNLVATKRTIAARLSDPTLSGLQEDAKGIAPTHFTDPALVQVWKPYTAEIRALIK